MLHGLRAEPDLVGHRDARLLGVQSGAQKDAVGDHELTGGAGEAPRDARHTRHDLFAGDAEREAPALAGRSRDTG